MAQLTDLPNLAPATSLSTDDLVPVWDNGDTRSPKRTTVGELLALGSTIAVATDAAKLALTGINAGQVVVITGEGNRVEMYTGGTITAQASWAVLRNTVQLSVSIPSGSGNAVVVGGVSVANSATPTSVGWVNPQALAFSAQGTTTLTLGSITARTTASQVSTTTPPSTTIAVTSSAQNFAIPVSLPHRGIVTMALTYPPA